MEMWLCFLVLVVLDVEVQGSMSWTPPPNQCEKIEMPSCQEQGYNWTVMPNLMGNADQKEAELAPHKLTELTASAKREDRTEEENNEEEERVSTPLQDVYISDNDSIFDTPRKAGLKKELRHSKIRNKLYQKENRKLKRQNTTLTKQRHNLKEIVKSLKLSKMNIQHEHLNEIKLKAEEANVAFQLILRKKKSRAKFSPPIRKLALTVHYYSPAAYKSLRGQLNNLLPHPKTLTKWYGNNEAEPGFTHQAFETLANKTNAEKKRIYATLMVDEMAIRQQTTWNGHKTLGLVDVGLETKNDQAASQAYVFMLVSNTANWKIPLGYFFINGLESNQRANLIKICLQKCHEVGVDVIGLTFDGCAANIAAAEKLGCNFDDVGRLVTIFPHPSTDKKVAVFLDAAHMLKLVRNTFESKRVFFDQNNKKIEWKFLVRLQKLQESEGLKFANKLTALHINFRNQVMKVKLASQLLSRSVAKSLELCTQMLDGWQFVGVEATIDFITLFNNLFDVFNSRIFEYGYRSPLCITNAAEILKFLQEAEEYIKSLAIYNKVRRVKRKNIIMKITKKKITQAKCKTGFLGFLISIRSLIYLYEEYIQNEHLQYLSTYRLSQDHLELFFGNMRQHGGCNNNPTTVQFKAIYKKILCHLELRSTFTGNCLPLDNFTILTSSSAVESLNNSCLGVKQNNTADENANDVDEYSQYDANCHLLADTLDDDDSIGLSNISEQVVGYIGGWVVRKLTRKLKCDCCLDALMAKEKLPFHKLITLKNMKGLIFPSFDVYSVCIKAERFIRLLIKQQGNHHIICEKTFKATKIRILHSFLNTSIFETLNKHSENQPVVYSHRVLIIKNIIDFYIDVRFHSLHKNKRNTNRQKFNKLILFKGL